MDFSKCRLWEVAFNMSAKLRHLPYPGVVVEEVQKSPQYVIEGRTRLGMSGAQLSCTLAGTGGLRIGNREYRLEPGTAFLHCHNDPRVTYFYPPEARETWRFLWLSFYGKPLESAVRELNRQYGYRYALPLDGWIVRKLQSYRAHRGTLLILSPLEGARLVMDILTRLNEAAPGTERTVTSERLRQAQEYIFAHLRENIGIREVAAATGISREHLARIFQKQLGESPSRYLHKKKMAFACKLLVETSLTVAEVAAEVGFDSSAGFIRAFRQLVKLTPGQLRAIGYIPDLS